MDTPPPELIMLVADNDEPKQFCPSRRMNKWGYWAVHCTWPADHSGTLHHDAHTSTTWEDHR